MAENIVEDLPPEIEARLHSRHPNYEEALAYIKNEPELHRTWKNLKSWLVEDASKARSARATLRNKHPDFEFATISTETEIYLAVRYTPEST